MSNFITSLEDAYGKYPNVAKTVMSEYLSEFDETYQLVLIKVVLESCSLNTKPSVPEFKKLHQDVLHKIDTARHKVETRHALQNQAKMLTSGAVEYVDIDGQQMTLIQGLFALANNALANGIKPDDDPRILEFKRKYTGN